MFIPAEYLLGYDAVQRVANSLAPEAMALTGANARKRENFDRQHRAISGALDRLLQALSDGGLTARLYSRLCMKGLGCAGRGSARAGRPCSVIIIYASE